MKNYLIKKGLPATLVSITILVLVMLPGISCDSLDVMPSSSSPAPASVSNTPVKDRAVLLFGIGIHIEPLGAAVSRIVTGKAPQPGKVSPGPDYHDNRLFTRHLQDIQAVVDIVNKHNGKLTVQAQTPFTQVAVQSGNTILADLEKDGHEIGLHFHEDVHLGEGAGLLSPATWSAVMAEEIDWIKRCGVKTVRYWSGGNLYPGLLEAASIAGLEVNSDWKNPRTQQTDQRLIGLCPWRPSTGCNGTDVSGFARHDPAGKIIFLPEGLYNRTDFGGMYRSENLGGDAAYFNFLKDQVKNSLEKAQPDRVNVFHFTVHPGEFRGDLQAPFTVIDRFLTEVIDPLVDSGQIQWATFSQMADAFKDWEQSYPGIEPRSDTRLPVFAPSYVKPAKIDRDIVYGNADGVALKMDVYYPAATGKPVPAVLYVHGGGWTQGDKALGAGMADVSELLVRGYLVAAINYRLAPQYKFPAQIEDVKCAVRFLRANAQEYGIDPQRIGAWGGSAGGHLVALLGTTDISAGFEGTGGNPDQSSRVQAVVDMFGPSDLSVIFAGARSDLLERVFGTPDHKSELAKRASPVTYISSDDPPFLILHGEQDKLVPFSQSQLLYDRLRAAGVPATLVAVKNAGHGFTPEGGQISPGRVELSRMMADFFDKYLKSAPLTYPQTSLPKSSIPPPISQPPNTVIPGQNGPWNHRILLATSQDGLSWKLADKSLAEQASVPELFLDKDGNPVVLFVDWSGQVRLDALGVLVRQPDGSWIRKQTDLPGVDPNVVQLT